jgi:L-threonylcarbamoyladenylate synthase
MNSNWHIQRACQNVIVGGVIAYPTESVWGLGCDPWSQTAVKRLLQLKQRKWQQGLILVASRWHHIEPLLASLEPHQRMCLQASWPGSTTWLLPDSEDLIPPWIRGQHSTVAVRLSAHPLVVALCDATGGLLVSTSANRSGGAPARTSLQVRLAFGQTLDYILPGTLGHAISPSQIYDLQSGALIRAGHGR